MLLLLLLAIVKEVSVSGTSKKSLSTFLLEFHVDPFRTKTT
jgi:hypothetical protein